MGGEAKWTQNDEIEKIRKKHKVENTRQYRINCHKQRVLPQNKQKIQTRQILALLNKPSYIQKINKDILLSNLSNTLKTGSVYQVNIYR